MPTHSEQRILPYRPEQLFELVADVGSYPEFLPWCRAARILRHHESGILAELVIGFRGIHERFTSRVALDRPNLRIDVAYEEGPFRYLENHWHFQNAGEGRTRLDFHVDFEFRSRMLDALIGGLFNEAVRRMVRAFETRAKELYGNHPGLSGAPDAAR